jgi:DNA-binding NarL/FixJ family response regulator
MPETNRLQALALITDLFFAMRVSNSAKQSGSPIRLIDNASEFSNADEFVALLASEPPKLIILDLNATLPWRDWLAIAKSNDNSSSIPWLAFGSHKDSTLLKEAKQLGIDKVLARSKFTEDLPNILLSLN